MLEGQDLIDFVTEHGDEMNQAELARAAGYTREAKDGKTHVLSKLFNRNLLAAKGLKLPVGRPPGNAARYETTVHANGIVLVGKVYTQKFGLEPGDEMSIQLDDDCIRLVPKTATASAAKAA